jgi:hypothetical protein
MALVVFDPSEFKEAKPEFGELSDSRLIGLFNEACLLLDNSDDSLVSYDPPKDVTRKTIFFLLVCHLATLSQWAASGQSGPVASATEGTVSVSYSSIGGQNDDLWWNQTPCGSTAWMYLKRHALGGIYVPSKKRHPWG